MCGIAGVFVSDDNEFKVSNTWLSEIRDEMIHRGPDGYGNWISNDEKVGLAHRRLSIIDLSNSAKQPMKN